MLNDSVTWAQRSSEDVPEKNYLRVTIAAADVEKPDVKIEPTLVTFKGTSKQGKEYALTLNLFDEIDPAESRYTVTGLSTNLILRKKELRKEFWPRLVKEKRVHYISTDFDHWVDEDEQDEAEEQDFGGGMPDMSALTGGGMGGLADAMGGGMGGLDFSKLGAMAGAGGLGGDSDDDEDAADDEEAGKTQPPPLAE